MKNLDCTPLHPCFDPSSGTCPPCSPNSVKIKSGEELMEVVDGLPEEKRKAYFKRVFDTAKKK